MNDAPDGRRQQGQKSSRGKGKYKPKGRMLDPSALAEVQGLLGEIIPQRDMLIEYLHVIQDSLKVISHLRHLAALAHLMRRWQKSGKLPVSMTISIWCVRVKPRLPPVPCGSAHRCPA